MHKKTFLNKAREKQIDAEKIQEYCQKLQNSGKTIVLINGAFDLLHKGHLHILYEAKKQGDVLLVALNTDESIKKRKGVTRPINKLSERTLMLCALDFVTYVTSFSEDDPRALIKKVCPNVHVNGSEYGLDCIEAETLKQVGARLHVVSLLEGHSSSKIINKISTCV